MIIVQVHVIKVNFSVEVQVVDHLDKGFKGISVKYT